MIVYTKRMTCISARPRRTLASAGLVIVAMITTVLIVTILV